MICNLYSEHGWFMQKCLCAGKEQSKMLAFVMFIIQACFPMKEAGGLLRAMYYEMKIYLTVVCVGGLKARIIFLCIFLVGHLSYLNLLVQSMI